VRREGGYCAFGSFQVADSEPFSVVSVMVIDSGVAFLGISKPMQPVAGLPTAWSRSPAENPPPQSPSAMMRMPVTLPSLVWSVVIAPVFAALALSLLLTRIPTWPLWIVVLAIGVVMIGVLVFAEYVSLSPNARGYATARLVLTGVSYAIAFVLFTHLYSARERSIISATLTSLVAAGLALDLMAPHIIGLRTAAVFSGIVGFVVGQATWALNYWNISNWSAGVLLLTVFYVLIGLAQQYFQDRLTRGVLIEFAVVALLALVVAWQLAGAR